MSFSFLPLPAGGVPVPDLVFQQMTLPALERDDGLWLRATDLARALGYPREDNVSRLYRRHADEFTKSMTQVVDIVAEPQNGFPILKTQDARNPLKSSHNAILAFQMTETTELERQNGVPIPRRGNPTPPTRIFSLRGCHLIAMLARTPVAKEFRRWVLDLLDALSAPEFSRARLARTMGFTDKAKALYFESGRMQGQMDRLSPERQALIYRVCDLLNCPIKRKDIAEILHITPGTVAYIARRYHRGIHMAEPWLGIMREYAPKSPAGCPKRQAIAEEPSHD